MFLHRLEQDCFVLTAGYEDKRFAQVNKPEFHRLFLDFIVH
ncbi:hypothetical protein DB29_03163 [Shouchella clausii]|nr:hypothetical protein DB29_03163 [Shouchella clausii]